MTSSKGIIVARVSKLLCTLCVIIGFICSAWILLVALAQLATASPIRTIAAAAAFGLVGLFLVFILLKQDRRFISFVFKHHFAISWLFIAIVAVLLPVFAFKTTVDFGWDWGRLIISASNLAQSGHLDTAEYFARYPNNQFWLLCLTGVFKIALYIAPESDLDTLKTLSILLACLFTFASVIIIYLASVIKWREKSVFVALALLCCTPLYLYSSFFYSDSPGLLLCSLLVLMAFIAKRRPSGRKCICLIIATGIISALVIQIKVMVLIVGIALAIDLIISSKDKRSLIKAISAITMSLLVCLACNFGLNAIKSSCLPISQEQRGQYEFPMQHWIMMGLGYGGFTQEDVDYTKSFSTLEERKRADIERIRERIEARGAFGTMTHVLWTKNMRTWGNPCLSADNYIGRDMLNHGIFQRLFSSNGDLHYAYLGFAWVYWIVILFGFVLSTLHQLNSRDYQNLTLVIALVGIFLFFSIWECNSRYLYSFLPVLVLLGIGGYISRPENNTPAHRSHDREELNQNKPQLLQTRTNHRYDTN